MSQQRFIIDFTWNPKQGGVKLLEMGDFFRSSFEGLDKLRKTQEKMPIKKEYLAELKNQYPESVYLEDQSMPGSGRVRIHDFKAERESKSVYKKAEEAWFTATYTGSDPQAFLTLLLSCAAMPKYPLQRHLLFSLSGIRLDYATKLQLEHLLATNKTNFTLLHYVSGGLTTACVDKVAFHQFCQGSKLIPDTLLVDLNKPDFNAIEKFFAENPNDYFIIKPTNESCGRGLKLVSKEQLIPSLLNLTDTESWKEFKPQAEENPYWAYHKKNKAPFLLIQTFHPSQAITVKEKAYYPTGRVIIDASFSQQKPPNLKFVDGYWKLPGQEITNSSQLTTEAVVSKVDDHKISSAPIDEKDWQQIITQIADEFTPLLAEMSKTSTEQVAETLQKSSTPYQAYATKIIKKQLGNGICFSEEEKPIHRFITSVEDYFAKLRYGSVNSLDLFEYFRCAAAGISQENAAWVVDKRFESFGCSWMNLFAHQLHSTSQKTNLIDKNQPTPETLGI